MSDPKLSKLRSLLEGIEVDLARVEFAAKVQARATPRCVDCRQDVAVRDVVDRIERETGLKFVARHADKALDLITEEA